MKISEYTQRMLNKYPMWARARSNPTSVASQFLTPVAEYLEEINVSAGEVISCRFPQKCNMWEAAFLHYVILGASFAFQMDVSDPFHPRHLPPTIVGDSIPVTVTDKPENFYNAHPTRFVLSATYSSTQWDILDAIYPGEATHYTTLGALDIPGPVAIKVAGCTNFFETTNSDYPYVQIEGIKRTDTPDIYSQVTVKEVVHTQYNKVYYTNTSWQRIDKITAVGYSANTIIQVGDVFGQITPRETHYTELYVPYDRDTRFGMVLLRSSSDDVDAVIQNTAIPPYSTPIISVVYEIPDEIYDYDVEYDVAYEFLTTHSEVYDYAVCPFTHFVYLLNGNGEVYVHDLRKSLNPYVNRSIVYESPLSELHILRESNTYGNDVRARLTTAHPLARHMMYSITLEYANGVKYSVKSDGTVIPFTAGTTIPADTLDISFALPSYEPALVMLKNHYATGRVDYDYGIVGVETSTPVAGPFTFEDMPAPQYMYFGEDQALYVGDGAGTICKYEPRFDYAIVDYDNKTVIMREKYASVEITA